MSSLRWRRENFEYLEIKMYPLDQECVTSHIAILIIKWLKKKNNLKCFIGPYIEVLLFSLKKHTVCF